MPNFAQANRLLSIDTPAGTDILLITQMTTSEAISKMFSFDIEMIADVADAGKVKPEDLLGQNTVVKFSVGDDFTAGPWRYYHGVMSRFRETHSTARFVHYQAEVVPWLWFLTLTADCRIFQKMTVIEVLTKIFDEAKGNFPGRVAYRFATSKSYTSMDYCVQYRETDFNFVSRLMEQEGIFYYFEHAEDSHTLVVGDSPTAHKPCPNRPTARYLPEGGWGESVGRVITWEVEHEMRPGKYTMRDHHFQLPTNMLEVTEPTKFEVGGNPALEVFDYPGEYAQKFSEPDQRLGKVKPEGQKFVKSRIEEEEAPYKEATGTSYCRDFSPGFKFDLTEHYNPSENGSYVLLTVEHEMKQTPFYLGEDYAEDESEEASTNTFSCMPASAPYRPPRETPKPLVQGPQTAVVVGKKGEEIWTDKFGRVKVQFFWDREGKNDEKSSCWVRVSQPWAGGDWGSINIPRIGQEVVVDFLEGDPDRPIITGRVYNTDQMPPYKLPDHQTRSTFKTRSTKGGSASNYNEIRLEDKKGKEQIFIHAEKDMDLRVKEECREFVGKNQHIIVSEGQSEDIGKDRSTSIGANDSTSVGQDMSLTVGSNRDEKVGQKHAIDAGTEIHLKAGMKVIIEAGMQVSLKGAGGFVDIGPAGVTISGTMVKINSGGAAGSGSGASPKKPKAPDKADDGSKGTKL